MTDLPETNLTMLTLVKPEGQLEVSLERRPMPTPKPHEVVVKVLAAPINPSDLGLLFGGADMSTARASTKDGQPLITADVPPAGMRAMGGRIGDALAIGNEGCGTVVAAGDSPEAQALLGKTVALLGGEMYAEYRCLPVQMTMALPDGTDPADGASCFVNPLTSLAFTETMKAEGHSAIVHTAAASNLGQMLQRICLKDGIALVNIVRRPEQVALLKSQGAVHVCDASAPTFLDDLTEALVATGATIAFDATGGGPLAGQILGCMEAALVRTATVYSRYGTSTHKQVYLYGGLDTRPTEFRRNFGMAWGMGGWLLFPFLQKIGPAAAQVLKQRVAAELKTTFASRYAGELSLPEVLTLGAIARYNQRATGEKYLIAPHKR
jgi:NADPH:quinone reductase-like Zn-dependent oxidoreductase